MMAINDACCFAFAAIAAKNVKTKLKPKLPKKEMSTNLYKYAKGFSKKIIKIKSDKAVINSISTVL